MYDDERNKKLGLTIENKLSPNVTTKCKKTLQIYIMYMHSNFELGSAYATICLYMFIGACTVRPRNVQTVVQNV